MQVKEIKKDGLSHELEITIPANDIDARVDERLKEVGKTIRMPGFRAGKVPLDILKKRYGKAVMGEVLEAAVNETSAQALEEKKIKPAMQPKIEVKEFDDGKDLVYSMGVEALPEFEVMDFKKLKVEKLVAKPNQVDIEELLEEIMSRNPQIKPIKGDRATKEGDVVDMDFHGRTADDNVAHEGMHAHGHKLKLGSGQFIPGFEDQLIGQKKGSDVEVKVSFPKDYGAKELAGREAIFDVKINDILEESKATKVDDDFAKSLGLENADALKESVSQQLEHELNAQSRMTVKKNLLDKLDEAHSFEIPQGMLDMEYNNIIEQVEFQRKNDPDAKDELTAAEKKEYKEIAERRVRLGMILAEVGNQNNITVSDPELQQAVIQEAQKYPGQEKQVFDYYSQNRQALESLRAPIYEDKVVDYILELAEVTEKKVTGEELAKALEDDEAPAKKPAKKSSAKKTDEKKGESKKKAPAKKSTAKKTSSKKK